MTQTTPSLLTSKKIHGTTACFPGESFVSAVHKLSRAQEAFGGISCDKIQLCPQTLSTIEVSSAIELQKRFPNTQFRLHANVRRGNKVELFDASSDIREEKWASYIEHMRQVNTVFGNPHWSIHAGRSYVSQDSMYDNLLRTQDYMGSPVAIEGLYPSKRQSWNLSSFEDYARLLKEGVYFALDLSHVQITATQTEKNSNVALRPQSEWEDLITQLMESSKCLEIHLSDNDHQEDTHNTLQAAPWWWSAFNTAHITDSCSVFTEGNQLKECHEKERLRKSQQMKSNREHKILATDLTEVY